ncbi:MAG: 3-hydroxyacyl-CoA dehydrogenase [Chitinophagaceae bacterium]|nr:3-hydroxyacyl-CoA dehydrogenase [Chitinophagaceae bacterium]
MKIFATGHASRLSELKEKIDPVHFVQYETASPASIDFAGNFASFDLLFDLNADDDAAGLSGYAALYQKPVIVCAVKKSLHQLCRHFEGEINCHLIGMNALPTFINRSKTEVSFSSADSANFFEQIAKLLNWEYLAVEDKVGMVTPRVIAMVINEACFTLQEKTATKEDIDTAMKLGTNYPWGPFEWCDRIGIKDVYETLEAIAKDTGDPRYKICELLRDKFLTGASFYVQKTNLK